MAGALASSRSGAGNRVSGRPIRLMIVDDSMIARAVLSRIVTGDGAFEIVAVAGSAEDAIEALGHANVDIILLDLEMPGVGGLKGLPGILKAANGARVLIVSSLAEEGAEETIQALALGAHDTLPKPGTGRFHGRFAEVLLGKLHALREVEVEQAERAVEPVPITKAEPSRRKMSEAPLEMLLIGASTGGIPALASFFQALPERVGVPILVTQHLPQAFMSVFARQLAASSGREAVVAIPNMVLQKERIHIAPGDGHLTFELRNGHLVALLDDKPATTNCMPSVDPMFACAGELLGGGALGVVLTGMGRDGTAGAEKLVACGGSVLAQDENSSAVWGMPRSVAEAGLVCGVGTPAEMAKIVGKRAVEI